MKKLKPKKIICMVGTRPEAIKMAPIILQLKKSNWAKVKVVATAQHREMLDSALALFNIKPDVDLNLMQPNQTLTKLTAYIFNSLDQQMDLWNGDAILAQGDTTTVMVAALCSYYKKIPFFHVEAGLRSYDLYSPFPEEANRIIAGRLATLNFAPTKNAKKNLLKEGLHAPSIYVTGNTIVDALLYIVKKNKKRKLKLNRSKKIILVTAHRRESFGKPLLEICKALRQIADQHPNVEIIYPVHLNPNVQKVVYRELDNHPRIKLCKPLNYASFLALMQQAYLILSDSGGVQEEAPVFGKPVLVLRSVTERIEGIETGSAKLVGTKKNNIVREVNILLTEQKYRLMAKKKSPYGNGKAAVTIVEIIKNHLYTLRV